MRKILFFQWNAFMQKGIERAFTYLGMEYDTFYYIFKDWDKDDDFKEKLKKAAIWKRRIRICFFGKFFTFDFRSMQ